MHFILLFILLRLLNVTRNDVNTYVSRHFSEIIAIWLAFDSLYYFTTELLIFQKKGEKVLNYHHLKYLGFGD